MLIFRFPRYLNRNNQCCTGQYVQTYCSTLLLNVYLKMNLRLWRIYEKCISFDVTKSSTCKTVLWKHAACPKNKDQNDVLTIFWVCLLLWTALPVPPSLTCSLFFFSVQLDVLRGLLVKREISWWWIPLSSFLSRRHSLFYS